MASGLIPFAFVLASGIINIMPNEVGAGQLPGARRGGYRVAVAQVGPRVPQGALLDPLILSQLNAQSAPCLPPNHLLHDYLILIAMKIASSKHATMQIHYFIRV
ncbi:hypothetical protein ACJJTC_005272 [Scirpophaga incertulas]